MNSLTEHKVALVTGAAQRIGKCIATELHHSGFNILLHYRSSANAALALVEQLNQLRPHSAHCLQANLSLQQDITQLAADSVNHWGRLDALVNNASAFYPTDINHCDETDWNELIDSNLKGAFFLSQALIPALKKNRGSITNLIDIHAEAPLENHSIYCIAKAGAAMMCKSLARELGPEIRVNGVAPGAILWPENAAEIDQQVKQDILKQIPLAKTGEPEDIAKTVKFLVCNAPYISGQIIAVDGGRSVSR